MLEPATVEKAEAEIDTIVARQAREEAEANEVADLWRGGSERAYHQRRRRENRAQWCTYHLDQAERIQKTAEGLVEKHRAKSEALIEEPGGGGGNR